MKQRGRQSSAAMAVVSQFPVRLLPAPADFNEAEAVNLVMPHLSTDEGLGRYKELRKMQGALSGELASLATKLRLTQQSRYTPASSKNRSTPGGRKPWEPRAVIDN